MSNEHPASDHSANLRDLLLNPTAADDRALLEPPTPEELQAALPGYEVSKMVGRGGMGAVYLGRQISLDRMVAVKVLPPHLEGDNENFVERFKNEAKAMAKLNHPGIVSVYDFGQTESGLLYFVMEFVEGTDVQRMISQQKRLKSAHAHAITAHVCDALAYAHERGLIHRDIKPANIMLSHEGDVKVADFGLAKAMNTNATALTQSGMVLGTLHYMAPESFILGAAVDHRADLYAVGVMLYQMLTGRVPSGVFELPSLQIPGLDPRFDDIITRAMREEREDRYQSAVEMRHDLDSMLTQPVTVKNTPLATTPEVESSASKSLPQATKSKSPPKRPPAQPPELRRFQSAQKKAAWGWGLATLLLLAGCGAYLWLTGVRVTFDEETTPAPLPPVAVLPSKTSMPEPEPKAAEVKTAPVPPSIKPASTPPKPSVPQTPPAQPQGNVIDLLALPDVAKGALSGQWALAGTALEVRDESTDSRSYDLVFPWSVRTPDEYDFEISFTLTASAAGAITMHLPTPHRRVLYYLQSNPDSKIHYGFNGLDGKRILDNPAASSALDLPLRPGIRHSAKVEVRSDSLRAFMNGKKIVDWSGDLRRFGGDETFKYDQRRPALGVYGGGVIFHKAVITERATQPAAAVAEAPPPAAPASLDFTEFRQLLQTHAADWRKHVRQPYDDGMALLTSQFTQALERGKITADPKKKQSFADELQRFKATGQPPPGSGDTDPFLPPQIPQFRHAFRLQATRLQQARDLAAAGVTKEFLDALAVLEKSLSGSMDDGRAGLVKNLRADLLAARKSIGDILPADPAHSTATPAVMIPSSNSGAPAIGGTLVFEDNFEAGSLSANWRQKAGVWHCASGSLTSKEAFVKGVGDGDWGCWLARTLPQRVRVEFDAHIIARGGVVCVELDADPAPDGGTSPSGTGYVLIFGDTGGKSGIQRGMRQLGSLGGGGVQPRPGDVHHMVVQRTDGQTLEWFVDGQLHLRAVDSAPKSGGWLGFRHQEGAVSYDNLKIFDLDGGSLAASTVIPMPPAAVTAPLTATVPAIPSQPDGRPNTGGTLVHEVVFPDSARSGGLPDGWICMRRQQGVNRNRYDYAWKVESSALVTYLATQRKVSDQGFGCWLTHLLPERARIEFDATLEGPTSTMICEFYANTPTEKKSPAGTGYSVAFGSSAPAPLRIQRGVTALGGRNETYAQLSGVPKKRHHMTIQRVDGRTVEWFVDGVLRASGVDADPKATGHLGFQFRGDAVRYENIKIYNLSAQGGAGTPPAIASASSPAALSPKAQFEAITDLPVMTAHVRAQQSAAAGDSFLVVKINVPVGIPPRHVACFTPQDVMLNRHGLGWVRIPSSKTQKRAVLTAIHPGCHIHEESVDYATEPAVIEREITLRPLAAADACLFVGQVLNPDRSPAALAIVRLGDWAWTRADDQGCFTIRDVSPGTLTARAESPEGELEMAVKFTPGPADQHLLRLKKTRTVGLRWTLQREPENSVFLGEDVLTGEAYISSEARAFSFERGMQAHDPAQSGGDFSLAEDRRGILYLQSHTDGTNGWHEESTDYDVITSVNQGGGFTNREYFYNSFRSRSPLKPGQVFTARLMLKKNYAKLEITHLPD